MSFRPRPYQQTAYDRIVDAVSRSQRVLVVSPTGSGKTSIAAMLAQWALDRGQRCILTAHQQEILDQAAERFTSHGMACGRWDGVHGRAPTGTLDVVSIGTASEYVSQQGAPDIGIIDEAHRSPAKTYSELMAAAPNTIWIGLTGTPWRLDGTPLSAEYQELIEVISVGELIEQGYLVRPEIYSCALTDSALSKAQKQKIFGDPIGFFFSRRDPGETNITFCSSKMHAEETAQAYREHGLTVETLFGNTPRVARRKIIERLKCGDIDSVCVRDVGIEGLDVPTLGSISILRATQSLTMYLQMCGRVMRPPGPVRIYDHGGNVHRFGPPWIDRRWDISAGRKSSTSRTPPLPLEIPLVPCPQCSEPVRPSQWRCPSCGMPIAAEPFIGTDHAIDAIDWDPSAWETMVIRSILAEGKALSKNFAWAYYQVLRHSGIPSVEYSALRVRARNLGFDVSKSGMLC